MLFIIGPFKNMLKTHLFSRFYYTDYCKCFAEYEQRTLYGALVVTLAMLLRLINCRFIIITITIIYYYYYYTSGTPWWLKNYKS